MQPVDPLNRQPAEETKKAVKANVINCFAIAVPIKKPLEKGDIISYQGSYGMAWPPINSYKEGVTPEHIYIATNELKIEEDDVVLDKRDNSIIWKADKIDIVYINAAPGRFSKIIGTTNKDLQLPGIANNLIITFIRLDGKITQVQVEMTVFDKIEPPRMFVVPVPAQNPRWKEWDAEKKGFVSKPKTIENTLVITTFS